MAQAKSKAKRGNSTAKIGFEEKLWAAADKLRGKLDPKATIRSFRIVQTEGRRGVSRVVEHYNLDAILAVGYCVRSHRGTQFRIWATERLREYLVLGFTMDDNKLEQQPECAELFTMRWRVA
ncbi:MAG: RhuM family protein [Pirellulaceae bacterium]